VKIVIEGKPVAKKRPRFARRGKFVATYSDQETEEGRFLLLAKGQIPGPMAGPLRVECKFYLPRPKGHFGSGKNAGALKASAPLHHVNKPDADNLAKFCLDVLNGLAWADDAQIVALTGVKVYADDGPPRTEIEIMEIASEF